MQLKAHPRSGSRVEGVASHEPAWSREWREAEETDRAEAARALTSRELLVLCVALLSAGAAAVHFAVTKDHLEEYTLFGVLFLAAAAGQLAWAAGVMLRPSRALLLAGAAGNLGIAAIWVLS